MNKGLFAKALWAVLLVGLLPAIRGLAAEDYVPYPSPNPFLPVVLEEEHMGAAMRHPFHKFRVAWDDQFKVWPKPRENHELTTVARLRASPRSFLHRQVEFDLFLNERGSFFRPFVSHFHSDTHYNFSAWNYGAEIWVKDQRVDAFPFLYVDLRDEGVIRKIQAMPRYASVHMWGTVEAVSEGFPWVCIADVEQLKEPQLTEASLKDLELAYNRMERRDWALASDGLTAALKEDLPLVVEMKIFEALGKALMEQRLYANAREALIEGLQLYGGKRIQLVDALHRDNRCVQSLLLLAESDLKLGRNEEALTAAQLAIRLDSPNPHAHVLAGLALAKLGQIREGLAEVDVGQRLAPDGRLLEARRARAQICGMQGNWAAAKAELDQGLLLRGNDATLRIELGDVLMAMGNFAAAQKEYEFSTTLAPDRPEPYYKLATAYRALGDAALKENRKDEAANFYAMALEKLKSSLQKDELYAPALGLQVEILRAIGKSADAAAVLAQGEKVAQSSFAMQNVLYEQARAQGDWAGMEKASLGAVQLRPNDPEVHMRLADVRTYRPAPDFAGAEGEYAAAARFDARNVNAWTRLAYVRNKLGMWSAAAQAAQQAVALDDNNGFAWLELASSRRQMMQWEGAVTAGGRAVEIQKNASARSLLAAIYLDHGDKNDAGQALALAKQAASEAQSGNDRAFAQSVLGVALLQNGQAQDARSAFMSGDFALGEDAWHNLWVGRCLAALGDGPGAAARLQKAANGAGLPSKLLERVQREGAHELKDAQKLPARMNPLPPAKPSSKANTPPEIKVEGGSSAVPVAVEPASATR